MAVLQAASFREVDVLGVVSCNTTLAVLPLEFGLLASFLRAAELYAGGSF